MHLHLITWFSLQRGHGRVQCLVDVTTGYKEKKRPREMKSKWGGKRRSFESVPLRWCFIFRSSFSCFELTSKAFACAFILIFNSVLAFNTYLQSTSKGRRMWMFRAPQYDSFIWLIGCLSEASSPSKPTANLKM